MGMGFLSFRVGKNELNCGDHTRLWIHWKSGLYTGWVICELNLNKSVEKNPTKLYFSRRWTARGAHVLQFWPVRCWWMYTMGKLSPQEKDSTNSCLLPFILFSSSCLGGSSQQKHVKADRGAKMEVVGNGWYPGIPALALASLSLELLCERNKPVFH